MFIGFLAFELLVNNASSDTLAFSLRLVPFLPVAGSPATRADSAFLPRLKFPSGSADTPFKRKFLSSNYLVNNWLPVLIIIPFEIRGCSGSKANSAFFVPSPKAQVTLRVRQRPLDEVSRFRPIDQDLHPSRPRLSQGHILHAHLTSGNTGEHTKVNSHKREV